MTEYLWGKCYISVYIEKSFGGKYMNFKRFRRGMAFALICSMALCSACGKNGGNEADNSSSEAGNSVLSEDDKNYVYKFNEIKLSEDISDYSINRDCVDASKDALYMLAVSYSDEGNNQKLFKLPNGAETVETIDFSLPPVSETEESIPDFSDLFAGEETSVVVNID